MKRAATLLFKRQSKNRAFFKIIELLLRFKTPGQTPRQTPGKTEERTDPTPGATRMCESPGVVRGRGVVRLGID